MQTDAVLSSAQPRHVHCPQVTLHVASRGVGVGGGAMHKIHRTETNNKSDRLLLNQIVFKSDKMTER